MYGNPPDAINWDDVSPDATAIFDDSMLEEAGDETARQPG
jgi:hypothetical protein